MMWQTVVVDICHHDSEALVGTLGGFGTIQDLKVSRTYL